MNEIIPVIAPLETVPLPAPYKDRSAGLVVFGILTILLGGLAALFVLLMLAGLAAPARTATPPPPFAMLLMVVVIYGTLAVALVWLGIGSILARRWARALLLIFSWAWLVMGVILTLGMALLMPTFMANIQASVQANLPPGQPPMPAGANGAIMAVLLGFFVVFFVITPACWTLFYHSRYVKPPARRGTRSRAGPMPARCPSWHCACGWCFPCP